MSLTNLMCWQEQNSSLPVAITPRMPKAGSELSEQQASTEMAFRLNHARQTVAFVKRQVSRHPLSICISSPVKHCGLDNECFTFCLRRVRHVGQMLGFALHFKCNCCAVDEHAMLQAASFSRLNKAKLGIWEALQRLKSLDEHRLRTCCATEQPLVPLFDHAVQTAELCRLAHPQQDWLHLVGLIHSLGKLMALPRLACY